MRNSRRRHGSRGWLRQCAASRRSLSFGDYTAYERLPWPSCLVQGCPGKRNRSERPPWPGASEFGATGQIGGFPALATAIADRRHALGRDNVLLVDGGDTFSDDLLGNLTKGEAMIRLMNAVGYDFMALGNHDFDYGLDRTRQLERIARFPMRGANIIERKTGQPLFGNPMRVMTETESRSAYSHSDTTTLTSLVIAPTSADLSSQMVLSWRAGWFLSYGAAMLRRSSWFLIRVRRSIANYSKK